ncbi:MAG: LPS assembly protein LptD [Candidatus Zixiibacteriota bacterium]|nr:MAG: LPS assembly protein LptD [candidate division Zixibacteria bacterium]
MRRQLTYGLIALVLALPAAGASEEPPLYYDSDTYEFIRGLDRDTVFLTGSAVFRHGSATLLADTAIWIKGERIILVREVYVQDSLYQLSADRVEYDLNSKSAEAFGDTVIIISEADSVLATGTGAYYNRDSSLFRMWNRPTVVLNFQDTARMTQVDADRIALDADGKIGYADGNVVIEHSETVSQSQRGIMYLDRDILLLLGEPVARRRDSEIKGDTLVLHGEDSGLRKIHVFGNSVGNFKEPSEKDSTIYDVSEIKASEVEFNFGGGVLDNIVASDQAYSFYQPGIKDSSEIVKNNVSGDTIKLYTENEQLNSVVVIGGAQGEYLTAKYKTEDTSTVFTEDTVSYMSDRIDFTIDDSTISLLGQASVENKSISLTAHRINYNTSREIVTAYDDSVRVDTTLTYYPVILNDGTEEIIGSYLEYSVKTDKGLIRKSKSEYQDAYYRGRDVFREKKNVYYVDGGTYTSCDQNTPHYHFWSKNMKMIQGDKIIARPVVFHVEKLPLMILPYYVFPTKPGRHSGFLSFRLGNFERGERYISNVGYYWAASEYWDVLGAIDYYEQYGITYRGTYRYNVRYKLSGSLTGSYTNESRYDLYRESKTKRWRIVFNHSQIVTPTFNIKASGTFLSDKSYYSDFSTDLEERLNRNLKSQLSLSKRLGRSSLNAQFVHEVALDAESRTDRLPSASFSLPSGPIFGSPPKDDVTGQESRKWYHGLYSSYSVSLNNYSRRSTDTTGLRSRRKYLTVNHSTSLSAPFSILKYLKLNPALRYQETWYKIYETDQSAGIDASQLYRRYAYSASVSASTDLYGTVNPNVLGLEGLRHVVTPRVSLSWAPEITRHNDVRSYTGVGGGGSKKMSLSFSLSQLFQAEVKSGEQSRKIDLFTIGSSFGYDFEAEGRKFTNLSTSLNTSLLKNISISASMVHELYKPGTEELRWWSPYLQSFTISTTFHTQGILSEQRLPEQQETLLPGPAGAESKQKWSLRVAHHYSESGRGAAFLKRHTISVNAKLKMASSLDVTYTQNYDFVRDRTVSRRVELVKNLHCWQGQFYWVPDGSNKGYYFRINVIAIPDIKFEKSESGIRAPYL